MNILFTPIEKLSTCDLCKNEKHRLVYVANEQRLFVCDDCLAEMWEALNGTQD